MTFYFYSSVLVHEQRFDSKSRRRATETRRHFSRMKYTTKAQPKGRICFQDSKRTLYFLIFNLQCCVVRNRLQPGEFYKKYLFQDYKYRDLYIEFFCIKQSPPHTSRFLDYERNNKVVSKDKKRSKHLHHNGENAEEVLQLFRYFD